MFLALCNFNIRNNLRKMSAWSRITQMLKRFSQSPMLASPIAKIVAANTGLFLLWRIKGISETFLVKHFSFQRFNTKNNRFHTLLTYAFSHFSFFSYLFNMVMLASFGKGIQMQFGAKYVWWLYLLGGLFGGVCMQIAMPYSPVVIPQVGADASISALLTFYGLFNLQNSVQFFFFPVKMWVLLSLMGFYCLVEPSKKNFGGMIAGLLVYQLFKVKII